MTLIDKFMDHQGSQDVCACCICGDIFDDDAAVALHWTENHYETPTVEETRRAFEADPERFRAELAESLAAVAEEEIWQRLAVPDSDDGYVIHHSPNVPRVRSRPSEHFVFIEREAIELPDQEIEELLEYEGLNWGDAVLPDEIWSESRHRTVCIDLRFCNILDGYIPLVRAVHDILPPLADGESVEVSWQDDPESWFPCKVSRRKRAIYNLDEKLKQLFKPLPSGARLYITRVGIRRYKLHLKHQPHTVRNCKVFISNGQDGWRVEFRDEVVEWETGDEVFRHQLTFQQMEALHDEARRKRLSVRDAVYDVMRLLAQSEPIHVRTVYDAVFLWMRTCSLAAVWAQFRPEHSCYTRVRPGWYCFDPSKPLPKVRIVVSPANGTDTSRTYSRPYPKQEDRYKIKSRSWRLNIYQSRLDEYRNDANACLEVRCGFGTPNEKVFVIPMPNLLERVIPNADCNERGQYLFTVSQNDFVFTWDHGFRMEGSPFLDRSPSADSDADLIA
ncbi:MAG: hypothetical protein PHY43_16025 [Verrucomicrobiales bacterium]|nr:hypothetical protein [Verrucomicrobiales bacterium]